MPGLSVYSPGDDVQGFVRTEKRLRHEAKEQSLRDQERDRAILIAQLACAIEIIFSRKGHVASDV
jgi:hypothetical protein